MKLKRLSEVSFIDQPSDGANVIIEDGGKLARTDAPTSNLAPAYDSTATYAKDDFCVNGGKLYQCNADISTAEAFNPAHWTEVKVTEVMGGGGGVTPEIMAQIENAQWKTKGEVTLFDKTVTTENFDGVNIADLSYAEPITADVLKVTFNGVEYTCPKISVDNSVAYGGVGETGLDFTEFPFAITSDATEGNDIYTATAGTYTISASVDTVTTTDTFKQAVNDIAGWKTKGEVTLFNENVTTEGGDAGNEAMLSYSDSITADPLKVTFNGVEYTCTKHIIEGSNDAEYGASYNIDTQAFDFSEYPFSIYAEYDGNNRIFTETPGTYTVSASDDVITYTDAFQKAVKSLGGAVEVANIDDADVVVVEVSERVNLISTAICTIKTDGTVTLVTNNTEVTDSLAPGLHLFYRCESSDNGLIFIGFNDYLVPNDRGSGVVIHCDTHIHIGSPNTSTMEILNGPIVRLADNGNIKYYKIGLPHNNYDSGEEKPK